MDGKIYFGNIRHAEWIKAPQPGMGASSEGNFDTQQLLNGGAFVSSSGASHRVYDMSWGVGQQADFDILHQYRNGDYGNGMLYLVDPLASDLNAMPPHVAKPTLFSQGWPSLLAAGSAPTIVDTPGVRTNLLTNPSFETNFAGWGANSVNIAATRDATVALIGTASLRGEVFTAPTVGDINCYEQSIVATPGVTYTGSGSMRASAAGTMRLTLEFRDASNVTLSNPSQVIALGALGAFTRFTVTGVAPANAAKVFIRFGVDSAAPVGFVWWTDGALLEASPVLGSYFDGSTTYVDGRTGAWTGTANASTSTIVQPYGDLPYKSARYSIDTPADTIPTRKTTLVIPPEQDLWIGYTGSATGSGVLRVRPVYRDGSYAATQDLVLLDAAGATRLNTKFSGAMYSAILVYMTQTVAGASTVTLTSAKAVYSTAGVTPSLTGGYVRGYGHTGLRIDQGPTTTYIHYNEEAGKKYVTAALRLTEVGAWL